MKPNFFAHVARQKGYYDPKKKYYKHHETTMDHLQKILLSAKMQEPVWKYLPFSSIITRGSNNALVDYDEVERILSVVRDARKSVQNVWSIDNGLMGTAEKYELAMTIQQECIDYIDKIRLTKSTMRYLLMQIEMPENAQLQRTLFHSLFGAPNKSFYELIMASAQSIDCLERTPFESDVCIYGIDFNRKICNNHTKNRDF